jgi:hypothetical protein
MWNHTGIPPPPHPTSARGVGSADYQQPQHPQYYHPQQQQQQQQQQRQDNAYGAQHLHYTAAAPPPPPPSYDLSGHPQYQQQPIAAAATYGAPQERRDAVGNRATSSGEPAWQRRRVEPSGMYPVPPRAAPSNNSNNYADARYSGGGGGPPVVVASTTTSAAAPLSTFKMRTVRPEQYDEFLASRPLGNLLQGTFLLSHFIPKPPPSSPPVGANVTKTITIDLDLWNNYWGEFSEHFSAHDEAIQAALQLQSTASGQEMGAGQGKLNRRGVIVKFPSLLSLDSFTSPVELQQHILRLATKFGVVEFCRVQHDEIRIQFTISSAAIEFASFARSLEASVMFPTHLLLHNNHSITHRSHPTAGGGVGGRVHVFLLDHRPPLAGAATASTQQYCTKLILGKRLDIPSMFLNALFRDLFEADHIEYQNGSFVVAFSSHSLCKYALHVLQQSFRQVFGLTLGYYDQKDVPALDLIG